MKKISLKNLNLNEVEKLTKEQLKNIFGGDDTGDRDTSNSDVDGGCAVACRTLDQSCVTADCQPGTCEWYMGFFGCVA